MASTKNSKRKWLSWHNLKQLYSRLKNSIANSTLMQIILHMDHSTKSTSVKHDIGTDEWRVYNVLQLNSSLLSAQSRRPSQRVHSGLHSPEPQRNCVSASQAGHTHNINSLDTCLAHHVPALVHCHVLAQCTFLHAAMYSAWLRVQHWLTEPRD